MSRLLSSLAAAGAVLLLAGCATATEADAGAAAVGALDRYLAQVYDDQAPASERNARVEELVAQCMKAEGFEYVPAEPITDDADDAGYEYLPDDADWVARYGYGIVAGPVDESIDESSDEDPNEAYASSLPEGERDAFWTTLYGDQDAAADEALTWEDAGCYGAAFHEVEGDDPAEVDENRPILDAVAAFWSALEDDPAFASLDAEWSDCMATAGHSGLDRQGDAVTSIVDAASALREARPDVASDDPELVELGRTEVALAVDDLGCRAATDYRDRATSIEHDLQERFVDDHRQELDALVARTDAGASS